MVTLRFMKFRRLLLAAIVFLLILGFVSSALSYYLYRRPLPQTEGEVGVAGLREPVSIYRDEWGVPHIYASSPQDLFFAQGYVHAQDRWWQMEVNRHIGKGELSQIFGNNDTVVTSDKLIRTIGWPRIAQTQWDNASIESKRALQSYAAGINRYIAERSQSDLAMQYTVLGFAGGGFAVQDWQPIDSLAWATVMNWHWDGSLSDELDRAILYGTLDPALAESYFPEMVWQNSVIQREDLPFENLPVPDSPPAYPPATEYQRVNTRLIGEVNLQDPVFMGLQAGMGSTLWAVNGANSESGLPLLANAPQTIISIPSQWYEIGLHCIEVTPQCPYDVVGFSAPGMPLIVAGHNPNIAWGIANAGIDTQDLYMVKLNPENPLQYEYEGAWQDFVTRQEIIPVNDDEALEWMVYQSRWGAIINDLTVESDADYVLALHWQGLAGDWIRMLLHLNRAATWEEFRESLTYYGGAPIQFLYADTQNNIGYQLAGTVPIRAADHSGLSPVLGDSAKYTWRGNVPFDYLPSVYNPKSGWIGAASQPIVPPEYGTWLQRELKNEFGADAFYNFTPYWQPTAQAEQLANLLTALNPHNKDTFATIQADTYSGFAEKLLPSLLALDFSDNETLQDYQTWLAEWDFRQEAHSPHMVLFATWWVALNQQVFDDQLGMESGGTAAQRYALLYLLDDPTNLWWDNNTTEEIIETRDDILRLAFEQAIETAESESDAPRDAWRWDELHTAHFVSLPVGNIGIVGVEEVVNRGPVGTGGGFESINATLWSTAEDTRFEVVSLPSFRMIIDLANFEGSRSIHPTGQSGHPASDHYGDMIDLWRTVTYHDMRWDSDLIREDENAVLRLQPDS